MLSNFYKREVYMLANEARRSLYRLIDQVAVEHEPVKIRGKRNTAVLIAESDWEDIEETLFVASHKELSSSILQNLNNDFSTCSTKLDEEEE
jgi:PHD/YefM family antitoxin component YafN of YafNO toxin-antitoxin module